MDRSIHYGSASANFSKNNLSPVDARGADPHSLGDRPTQRAGAGGRVPSRLPVAADLFAVLTANAIAGSRRVEDIGTTRQSAPTLDVNVACSPKLCRGRAF
jgi:hypothetical protein